LISAPSQPCSAYPPSALSDSLADVAPPSDNLTELSSPSPTVIFAVAVTLVTIPVFIQAPLVRWLPILSLVATGLFVLLGHGLHQRGQKVWGDLIMGFAWTWLAGSVYWGWLRWEPYLHLPVEAIGLPWVIWALQHQRGKVGHLFYLGSLLGTALTDVFFYITHLIPYWRQLMQVENTTMAQAVLHQANQQIQTPSGFGWAMILATLLLICGIIPLRSAQLHWWAFGGAVLSTILVDGLFWLAANQA